MRASWKKLLADESGQDLAEYGLLIAIIAIGVMAAVAFLGGALDGVWNRTGDGLQGNLG